MNRRERRAAAAAGRVSKSKLSAIQAPSGRSPFAVSDDDGRRLAVARPAKPEVALQMAADAIERNDPKAIDADFAATGLPEAAGPYTFAGWLAAGDGGVILDEEGRPIDKCQPGDSFVTIDEAKLAEAVLREN